jgi:hypothetical protein
MSLKRNAAFWVRRQRDGRALFDDVTQEQQTFSLGGIISLREWNYANDTTIINSCLVSRYRSRLFSDGHWRYYKIMTQSIGIESMTDIHDVLNMYS